MLGQDGDNLKRLIGDANAFRNAELAKPQPLNVVGITILFGDGKQGHLQWSTGLVDTTGASLPDDWIVVIDG
jgi:hypothetical protein